MLGISTSSGGKASGKTWHGFCTRARVDYVGVRLCLRVRLTDYKDSLRETISRSCGKVDNFTTAPTARHRAGVLGPTGRRAVRTSIAGSAVTTKLRTHSWSTSLSDVAEMNTVSWGPESPPSLPNRAHQPDPSTFDHHVERGTNVVARAARRSDWERLSGRRQFSAKDPGPPIKEDGLLSIRSISARNSRTESCAR